MNRSSSPSGLKNFDLLEKWDNSQDAFNVFEILMKPWKSDFISQYELIKKEWSRSEISDFMSTIIKRVNIFIYNSSLLVHLKEEQHNNSWGASLAQVNEVQRFFSRDLGITSDQVSRMLSPFTQFPTNKLEIFSAIRIIPVLNWLHKQYTIGNPVAERLLKAI